jgi:hypothetical protein
MARCHRLLLLRPIIVIHPDTMSSFTTFVLLLSQTPPTSSRTSSPRLRPP